MNVDALVEALLEERPLSLLAVDEIYRTWRGRQLAGDEDSCELVEVLPSSTAASSTTTRPTAPLTPAPLPVRRPPNGHYAEFQMPVRSTARQPNRYYTVTRVRSGDERHLGVWTAPWHVVADALGLPNRSLAHSGCHAVGFAHVGPAVAYWTAEGWAPPAPRLPRA